jgi:hypothetical protein
VAFPGRGRKALWYGVRRDEHLAAAVRDRRRALNDFFLKQVLAQGTVLHESTRS